jgi:hypothetical protein
MGASDYMVGNAPQGVPYAPPLVGDKIGQAIGDLPKDYYEGQKRQRELAVMNAFPNGLHNRDGSPMNYDQIADTLIKAGGGQMVTPLLQFYQDQQIGQQAAGNMDRIYGGTGRSAAAPAAAPQAAPQAAPAANTTTGPAQLATKQQAAPAAAPQDSSSVWSRGAAPVQGMGPSVLQILAGRGLPVAQAGMIAKDMGIMPTDPVNMADPVQRDKLVMHLTQLSRAQQAQQQTAEQLGVPAQQPGQQQPSAPGPQLAQNGGPPPMLTPGQQGGQRSAIVTPQSEAPEPAAATTGTLKSGPFFAPNRDAPQPAQPSAQRRGPPPRPTLDPPGNEELAAEQRSRYFNTMAAQYARRPELAKAYHDASEQAEAVRSQLFAAREATSKARYEAALKDYELTPGAKDIGSGTAQAQKNIEVAGENAKLTPAQKDAIANTPQGAARPMTPAESKALEDYQKDMRDRSKTIYAGGQGKGKEWEEQDKPFLDLAQGMLNRAEVYTGFAGEQMLDFKRLRAMPGVGDRNAAVLEEGLQKITSMNLLSALNGMKLDMTEDGEKAARVFQGHIQTMMQSAASMKNTVAGNLMLVHIKQHVGELAGKVAQMQRDYVAEQKAAGKVPLLDEGYDQKLSAFLRDPRNALFNETELRDPRVLAAPDLPPPVFADVQKNGADNSPMLKAWETQMRLKPGQVFHTPPTADNPRGAYIQVPRPGAQAR